MTLPPAQGAVAGTFLHGLAGDVAEERVGQMALRATDLLRWWPAAVAMLLKGDDDDANDDGDGDDDDGQGHVH